MTSIHDPFADLVRLRNRVERLFDEAGPPARTEEAGRVWRPLVDLPGIDQEKLDIELAGEELVVR